MSDLRHQIKETRLVHLIKEVLEKENIIVVGLNMEYSQGNHIANRVNLSGDTTVVIMGSGALKFKFSLEGYFNHGQF